MFYVKRTIVRLLFILTDIIDIKSHRILFQSMLSDPDLICKNKKIKNSSENANKVDMILYDLSRLDY